MTTGEPVDQELLDAIAAELRASRLELDAMTAALDQAHAELERARQRLVGGSNPADALRELLALLLPEMGRPALLVDADLWVVASNEAAARAMGVDPSDLGGSSLTRWPHALARARAVRHALQSPIGRSTTEHGDVVMSLGFEDRVASTQRAVLVMLGSES
jgi:PAS domain-containing protein